MHVAAGAKSGQKFSDVIGAARLHGYVDCGIAEIDAVVGAIVGSLHDVGAMLRQNPRETMKRSGIIWQMNAEANQSSIFDETALHDAREQADVNISAADQHGNLVPTERSLVINYGCDGCCSRTFRESLFAFEQ